ncbi:tetrapyrrole methylase [Aureococcus anophagefferens]|nr:tetrapyrrole methylase [Aureococcus anophagefferens]
MLRGDVVALVSDAGTPAVSDPGALLVREAAARGVVVRALPGACAATTALSASGFDSTNGFIFRGFVGGRGRSAARRRSLAAALASADDAPTVLYESPKRVRSRSARGVAGVLGDAAAWIDGGGAGAAAAGGDPRGEFTLVLDARPAAPGDADDLDAAAVALVADLRGKGLSAAAAAKAAAAQLGLRKSRVYQLALDAEGSP